MNLYDEALESIDKLEISKEYLFQPVLETIIKALERAKKVEDLLELKNELIELLYEYNTYLYQDFLHTTEMKELIALKKNEIKQLEEELK